MPSLVLIEELESAFGTILSLEKDNSPGVPQQIAPARTGPFRLLDCPRELRDRIYFHYLYKPSGFSYVRTNSRNKFLRHASRPQVNLFLTSKQVYGEAFEAFCRWNYIRIHYKTRLAGTLRLFPEKPAQSLQRIKLTYQQGNWRGEWPRTQPSGAFAQMMIEARKAKEFFPLLRECLAVWYIAHVQFEQEERLFFRGRSPSESTLMFLRWMRWWYNVDKLMPPPWLKIEFAQWYHTPQDIDDLSVAFNDALEQFKQETRSEDGNQEDLEQSGRKWLEEEWSTSTRRKRR